MTERTWLITGVSSGIGHEMTEQLLQRGDRVVGTVRKREAVAGFVRQYPDRFRAELLDVTDVAATKAIVDRAFAAMGASTSSSAMPATGCSVRRRSCRTLRSIG
jgi:NAD(P)-dependent dehydrogenase (short-subunit alcohol dehydrogenase family)